MAGLSAAVAGCGSDDDVDADSEGARPTVVVTTNILGDVVENLVGDEFDVVTVMPVGADPHDFQPSAEQVAQIGDADVLIVNGGDFEEGLLDVIASVEDNTPVFEAIDAVAALEFGEDGPGHEEHGEEAEQGEEAEHAENDHGDEEEDHGDADEHGHGGEDPHFFTDPARMALAASGMIEFLADSVGTVDGLDGVDAAQLRANAQAYIDELNALDAEVKETLAAIPADDRVLVTNHEVFAYFADRYDFEVVGTVIPTGATTDGVSAEGLAELAEVIEHEGVSAIFADTSSSDELAQTLAAEVGDVQVVELFSESLGKPGAAGASYIDMVRVNAQRIADALAA
jgi:zinc/manganese transport system substrate-binding protein